jgi:hypothetical protein
VYFPPPKNEIIRQPKGMHSVQLANLQDSIEGTTIVETLQRYQPRNAVLWLQVAIGARMAVTSRKSIADKTKKGGVVC